MVLLLDIAEMLIRVSDFNWGVLTIHFDLSSEIVSIKYSAKSKAK